MGDLKWLFTGTLLAMLVAHPLFAALVARWPRRKFVTAAYRFFIGCLVAFWALLWATPEGSDANLWIGRAFFVWTSVFNLFVVSVFWSFMTDIHRERRSRRLFGLIGVGGTLGAIHRVLDCGHPCRPDPSGRTPLVLGGAARVRGSVRQGLGTAGRGGR